MGLPYRAKAVANFFLMMGRNEGVPITPLKLQKLIYFAHGWCLAIAKKPLIQESIEAWRYGPVIANLYYEFREFGSHPITRPAKYTRDAETQIEADDFTVSLLKKVWDEYKAYGPLELSAMTHLPNTPWKVARHKIAPEKFNVTISDELIKEDFLKNFANADA
ncbi:MAG: type II toxin-antitoxin system antitoxin SocA domain-containing protein [Cyanobacteria bacterium J06623_4]